MNATLYANVYNLCDYYYVKDAQNPYNENGTWSNATYAVYSFGRTFSLKLKVNF